MAAAGFKAPIGTRDVLPPESGRWERLVARFATLVGDAGYGLVQSPMFEDVGVFERVGDGTDIVRKEMYDFVDRSDRHLALRPEGTASIVRAYLQHRPVSPWKVWYAAPSFRYERPQAGRYRQHHQLGAEAVGSADPDLDVELISLAWDVFASVGLRQVVLLLNSMGTPDDRLAYGRALTGFLEAHRGDLAAEDRDKVDAHPLRVLDSRRSATAEVLSDAPRVTDSLSDEAAAHFDRVRAGLGALGIPFVLEPRLVRGLDYYTHTTFEFQASALDSAQDAIGGGGRYDGLAASLGGPETPGVGFAAGIERLLLACDAEDVFGETGSDVDVFVVDITDGTEAMALTAELRRAGISADRAFDGRSMKAQMKAANRSGARVALIIGEDEQAADTVAVRELRTDAGQRVVARSDLLTTVVADLDRLASTDC
jgi:histidyl-tRNA synthetase